MNLPTVVSAPGKVFLAGGYLVLDRKHTALTFGLDARIHAAVQSKEHQWDQILVHSPQFQDAFWSYQCDDSLRLRDVSEEPNPFVQTALQYALSFVGVVSGRDKLSFPWSITILADNEYYSRPMEEAAVEAHEGQEGRFHDFKAPISSVNKTGLGSSAALVTALTSAVLQFCYAKAPPKMLSSGHRYQDHLHRLAQLAHCAAQGKVGSGFDVASAVFGSCIYRRFSPSIPEQIGPTDSKDFARRLVDLVTDDAAWDYEINKDRKVSIPEGLCLAMCDVDCGSQTPGMVKQVLKWREANRDAADKLWAELQDRNDELADRLERLSEGQSDTSFAGLRSNILEIRRMLQNMSSEAGVPIEPPEQTALLDACSQVPEVIGGVVPGAGGYDAITLMMQDSQSARDSLKGVLQEWRFGAHGGKVRLLNTRGEMEGTRLEDPKQYQEWLTPS